MLKVFRDTKKSTHRVIIMAFMAVKRNRKKNQTKKNFDEIFKKFDHNQNQRVSIREFTEVGEDIFKGMVGRYTAFSHSCDT